MTEKKFRVKQIVLEDGKVAEGTGMSFSTKMIKNMIIVHTEKHLTQMQTQDLRTSLKKVFGEDRLILIAPFVIDFFIVEEVS